MTFSQVTAAQAEQARGSGVVLVVVGVGEVAETELVNIAGDPSRVLRAQNYARLGLVLDRLTSILCRASESGACPPACCW